MKKIFFILMFTLLMSPAFAEDSQPYEDVYEPEEPPTVTAVPLTKSDSKFQKSKNYVKNIFSKKNKGIEKAEEKDVVEPEKTIEKVQKEQKKSQKKSFFKTKNKSTNNKSTSNKSTNKTSSKKFSDSKNNSNIKELNNLVIEAGEDYGDVPAVNTNTDNNNQQTDAAYSAGIDTTRILEVNRCVRLALENHPAIRLAMGNAEVYKSRIAQAWANYFPTLSAGISYSKNDTLYTTKIGSPQRYDMYYVPSVSGNLLLFDFGKTKSQADIAKRSYESAKFTLQNSINNVIFGVKQAYYNLLFAQQQVKVYEDTVADYKLHLEQADAYYRIGTKAKIDVLTAEQNLGNAEYNLIQAKNTLKIAYVQLSNAMGMPDYSDYEVVDNLKTKVYAIDVDEAVNRAYETSPELLASKKKAEASEVLVRATRRAFAPDISGFAGYNRGGKRVDFDDGYQIGAQMTYSNINLLQLKKQVDEAKAAYKRDFAEYENTKQLIYIEVKEAYYNLVNAQESIVAARLTLNRAKEQYELASGRYKVGLGDAIELKDAETTYRNAQLNYYNSLLSYHVSAANLERVMGVPVDSSDEDL